MSTSIIEHRPAQSARFGLCVANTDLILLGEAAALKKGSWEIVHAAHYAYIVKSGIPITSEAFSEIGRQLEGLRISYKAWIKLQDSVMWLDIGNAYPDIYARVMQGAACDPCNPDKAEQLAFFPYSIFNNKGLLQSQIKKLLP